MKTGRQVLLHVILPLAAGLIIYLFCRSGTWLHRLLLFSPAKPPVIPPSNTFSRIIAFNVPDFCWCYSLSSALLLWEQWQHKKYRWLPAIVLLILLANEAVQYFLPSVFTFDLADMIAAILAFGLSFLLIRKDEKI